ncbi:GNAT family N-acetyltransferase [Pseudomonas sp. MAFF212428]|uniref:GNAT family N-acetyltransferase n=1 Tax=Pseudomonas brassicae TaxID=2708063 RepID=A0A6B3P117_9PSED|nr:GNAT family N-acetyltransferase [Pseudomonas brassicae]NER60390.1 GNAT family N-acetyltransferase [Pseudomonas brassicae]NER66060.1 GNAT family N-acetyltransferase [Pseudomonas brassicae]
MIDWLSHHPHHSNTLAQWLHQQFHYEYADQPLAQWQQAFAQGQTDGSLLSLIALNDNRLLGSASLAREDLPQRPDLGPWLACVFVAPEARGQGIAEALIEGVLAKAKALGHSHLYLHTHDRADYYHKRGWQHLEPFQAWGKSHWLMQYPL